MSVELDRPNVLNIQDALCMGRCTLQKNLSFLMGIRKYDNFSKVNFPIHIYVIDYSFAAQGQRGNVIQFEILDPNPANDYVLKICSP